MNLSLLKPAIQQSRPLLKPLQQSVKIGFGSVAAQAGPVQANRLLELLDFTAVGASPVKQVGVIFTSLIGWRLLAANDRRRHSVSKRWNELRENMLRDFLGFGFWFLGVPVIQRLYLGLAARKNPQFQNVLMHDGQSATRKASGVLDQLKAKNPLNRFYIPSTQQVRDQMTQALNTLESAGFHAKTDAYLNTQKQFNHLMKHRNYATAIGLSSTILLLGIGVNLFNYYLTQKNVAHNPATQPSATPPANPFQQAGTLPALNPQFGRTYQAPYVSRPTV